MAPPLDPTDYLGLVLRLPRIQFVAACPFLFLIGGGELLRQEGRRRTLSWRYDELTARIVLPIEDTEAPPPMLLAVRQVKEGAPGIIRVGRTDDNDVVVADASVSRSHAFFRVHPRGLELCDAGAKNGTFVGRRRLQGRRSGCQVKSGDKLRFGRVALHLIDAGTCWDQLRDTPDW